jgi:hypothetical protein
VLSTPFSLFFWSKCSTEAILKVAMGSSLSSRDVSLYLSPYQ